ncbi:unnamed protein product [Meganyctiphanes norvegica]|uniref:Annexin n=1 Tax=Meganyctiphanes norvegica TaxID=48144 RepID=A0AAV2PLU3_MEGNR
MEPYNKVPTLNSAFPFSESEDAEALRKAMKGMGTDEKAIINIIAKRPNYQRQLIGEAYKQAFEKNLLDDLKSELGGHFEDVMLALMTPMSVYLAKAIQEALKKKHNNTLIEILCTRDKQSIESIKKSYMEHGKELPADLNRGGPSLKFYQFLIAMITEVRSDVTDDTQLAKYLSQKLSDAVKGKAGKPIEVAVMEILTKYSYPMLRMAFKEFSNIQNDKFESIIDSQFPDELKGVMKTVYESITSPAVFFAKELNSAIAGVGTDDPKLIRLVVSRCEIDMGDIKVEYEKLYKESLEKAIKGDTSKYYKKALLALIES